MNQVVTDQWFRRLLSDKLRRNLQVFRHSVVAS